MILMTIDHSIQVTFSLPNLIIQEMEAATARAVVSLLN